MHVRENNYAFVDGQNVHLGTLEDGWMIDFPRFRKYLHDKHRITKAFWFIGYIPSNEKLYKRIREAEFQIVFKEIGRDKNGRPKGNVDAELVLQTMHELHNFDKATIVSGDGDFACLVRYLRERDKLLMVLAPTKKRCSHLLKRAAQGALRLLSPVFHHVGTPLGHVKRKGALGGHTTPRTPFHG